MIMNTNKSFGMLSGFTDQILNPMEIFFPGFNALSRLFWGIMMDYVRFKTLYITLLILEIISSSIVYFSVQNIYFYFAINMIAAICYGGQMCLYPTLISNIFGIKYFFNNFKEFI